MKELLISAHIVISKQLGKIVLRNMWNYFTKVRRFHWFLMSPSLNLNPALRKMTLYQMMKNRIQWTTNLQLKDLDNDTFAPSVPVPFPIMMVKSNKKEQPFRRAKYWQSAFYKTVIGLLVMMIYNMIWWWWFIVMMIKSWALGHLSTGNLQYAKWSKSIWACALRIPDQ